MYRPKKNIINRTGKGRRGIYIVGVMFRNNKVIYDFKSKIPLKVGEKCIVESRNREEFGTVFSYKRNTVNGRVRRPLKNVLRRATEEDFIRVKKNVDLEKRANIFCNELIQRKKLKINLVSVVFSFSSTNAIFYYTSDERIELRDTIRELADHFKIRIELKQIGLRDAARMLGGCGLCGRKLCCASFLKQFQPVNIRMAKDQEIPLAPMKILGVCNRLLCCLVFEHSTYKEFKKGMPKCGQIVETREGKGKVIDRNILQGDVSIKIEGEKIVKCRSCDVKVIKKNKRV